METPVRKRKRTTQGEVGPMTRMRAFAAEAMSAAAMKKRRGSKRSESPKNADARLPTTNPAWTALV
jgi:hypothetical protein